MPKFKERRAAEVVGIWLSEYLPEVRMLSPGTIDSYGKSLQLYHEYLMDAGGPEGSPSLVRDGLMSARMRHFDAAHVAGFVEWLRSTRGNCTRTIEQRLAAIRSFLEYAAITDLACSALLVQAQKVKVGKRDPDRLVGHMSVEAWDAVVAQPKLPKRTEHRNWVFMVLMYEIAGRNSEVIGLRLRDLVLTGDEPRVYVTGKGNKAGVVPIRESVARILRDYISRFHPDGGKPDDPLFYVIRNGGKLHMSPDCSEAFMKRYGELARSECPSVPDRVHPHLVRHTRSMHLKEAGMTDEELALFLRHSGTGTVKAYAQASASAKRKTLDKANGKDPQLPAAHGFWEGDEDLIRRLANPGR
ncbi:MAG: tyrosine-type recombinase/integrase [Eggerthellaceae bacterium]|nr:tyrosine-type recombinase/integrase [Eggerthellaceae bacterium]